ncbi:MAG: hypothetical protein KBI01_10040 [Oscillospiraceae bacterium]|nr:hypothetical protein [Oscillospiraceae bacterium]
MKKRWIIVITLLIIAIMGLILYFSLFYLPSEKATINEFSAHKETFVEVVEFLQKNQVDKIIIDKDNVAKYDSDDFNFILKKLNYQEIVYNSTDSINFIKRSAFDGSFTGIVYCKGNEEPYKSNSYSLKQITENWYYLSYWT